MKAQALTTARLMLSGLMPEEVSDAYVDWLNDPEINRFLEVRHARQDLVSTRAFVESINGSDHSVLFAMRLKKDGRHIGNIKLGPVIRAHSRADIGLMIGDREAWGKGFATEAIAAVTRHAHEDLGLAKVTAGIYASNLGSIAAFLKAGFVEEARLSRHWRGDHDWEDDVLFAHFAERRA